jgi:protoporphyrinogen oxidase
VRCAGLRASRLRTCWRRKGIRVTVLEADDVVGGISRTARYKEFRFDIGGHRFFTKSSRYRLSGRRFLGEEFLEVPRLSRIHYDGKYFDYPLRPLNALSGLGVINAVRSGWSYMRRICSPNPVEENFEQWVTNRFGQRLYEIFFKTYTEKVWGIPCTEIRAEWAAQRIQGLSLAGDPLVGSLNKRSTRSRPSSTASGIPRLGPGQMWETCRDRIQDLGGQVLMEHQVTGLELEGVGVTR